MFDKLLLDSVTGYCAIIYYVKLLPVCYIIVYFILIFQIHIFNDKSLQINLLVMTNESLNVFLSFSLIVGLSSHFYAPL